MVVVVERSVCELSEKCVWVCGKWVVGMEEGVWERRELYLRTRTTGRNSGLKARPVRLSGRHCLGPNTVPWAHDPSGPV